MTDQLDRQPPVRQSRAEAARAEQVYESRVRRRANDDPSLRRLNVPEDVLDRQKYVYRSVNDEGLRIHNLKGEGWEMVKHDGVVGEVDSETAYRYRIGSEDGKPVYAYLMAKLRKFAEIDAAEKEAVIQERTDARLKRIPGDAPDQSYTPTR